jgi:hypothetical protein
MTEKINKLIDEGNKYTFQTNCYQSDHGIFSKASVEMQAWIAEVEDFLLTNFGEDSSPWRVFKRFERRKLDGNYGDTFDEEKNIIISALKACLRIHPRQVMQDTSKDGLLNNLFDKFHLVVQQLRNRHNGRTNCDLQFWNELKCRFALRFLNLAPLCNRSTSHQRAVSNSL